MAQNAIFGINSNLDTGGILDNQNEVFVQNYIKKVPMRRMGNPDDIAGPAMFLASDQAAFITGQTIIVDGGYSIG